MSKDIKRMLELAAKAAGINLVWRKSPTFFGIQIFIDDTYPFDEETGKPWVPQDRDGDTLRLQVTLGLLVAVNWDRRTATAVLPDRLEMTSNLVHIVSIPKGSDGMAETRLAVLMAAAAVGEVMS